MDPAIGRLADAVIERHRPRTLQDLVRILPRSMCHVVQEPRVFGTFQPQMVRLAFPESEWERHDERYRQVRDEVIPAISTADYLAELLKDEPRRLPCFCSQMADAAAPIASRMLDAEVYVLRNVYVNYLYLPQRWHCINAVLSDGRVRYFDTSAYAQVIDKATGRILRPDKLPGFDAGDIDESFVVGEGWLQSDPFPRRIYVEGGRLVDTFSPSPIPGEPTDEYFRVVR